MSKLEVNTLAPQTGTTITIGESGDTVALGSGATQSGFGGENTPAFFVSLSADHAISGANTNTKVQFDTELFDTDNCYDNTTNYRFTPTTAGKYLLVASVNVFTSSGDWNNYFTEIQKNGTRVSFSSMQVNANLLAGGGSVQIPSSAVCDANGSTDYFEVYFRCNSANAKANGDSTTITSFYGCKLIGV